MGGVHIYGAVNFILRILIWIGMFVLILSGFIGELKAWMYVGLLVFILLQDFLMDGGPFNDTKVFIAELDRREDLENALVELGFKKGSNGEDLYVRTSRYLRFYIASFEEKEGRLIVSVPRKFVGTLYSRGTSQTSVA